MSQNAASKPLSLSEVREEDVVDLDLHELTGAVVRAAKGLRYGSIEIVIHDARVVQVVRTEKRRISK